MDPSLPSGCRVHQRDHPRDRGGVPQGQRRAGDGRRIVGQSRPSPNHGTDSQVVPVRPGSRVSRIGASIGISLGPSPFVLAREAAATSRNATQRGGGGVGTVVRPVQTHPAKGRLLRGEWGGWDG